MKFTIYIQDECDYCKQIVTPEGLNVNKVYINRDDFDGFKPPQVPVMQVAGVNFEGPYQINDFFKVLTHAIDGKYNK